DNRPPPRRRLGVHQLRVAGVGGQTGERLPSDAGTGALVVRVPVCGGRVHDERAIADRLDPVRVGRVHRLEGPLRVAVAELDDPSGDVDVTGLGGVKAAGHHATSFPVVVGGV